MDARQIIIKPIVTEKSYALADVGKYLFRVHPQAHKTQISQAVEELFSIQVVGVRTMNIKPKPKRRGVHHGRTRSWKKAIVQVKSGQTIPVFQGLEEL